LRKYLELFAFEDEDEDDDEGEELLRKSNSLLLASLSSSLMVSSILEARCLMTFTNCGGATSVTNLAIRAFAIELYK